MYCVVSWISSRIRNRRRPRVWWEDIIKALFHFQRQHVTNRYRMQHWCDKRIPCFAYIRNSMRCVGWMIGPFFISCMILNLSSSVICKNRWTEWNRWLMSALYRLLVNFPVTTAIYEKYNVIKLYHWRFSLRMRRLTSGLEIWMFIKFMITSAVYYSTSTDYLQFVWIVNVMRLVTISLFL